MHMVKSESQKKRSFLQSSSQSRQLFLHIYIKQMTTLKQQDFNRQSFSPWIEESSRSHATSLSISRPLRQVYSPYSTVDGNFVKNEKNSFKARQTLKKILISPFRRINRIDKMIMTHKKSNSDLVQTSSQRKQLKPKFKIKSHRNTSKKDCEDLNGGLLQFPPTVPLKCFTLERFYNSKRREQTEQAMQSSLNCFQQTFKKRCRLQKKSPKGVQDASLLDRLSKITDHTPLQRYKSRAFGQSTRVSPFFENI